MVSHRWAIATLLLAATRAFPTAAQQPVTAFVHVAVVPMDRERVLSDQTVLVQGDRIVATGPAAQTGIPAGAVRIDGRGKYLLPGLADMHAHLPGVRRWTMENLKHGAAFSPGAVAEAERMLALHVANGVTTIRVMFGAPEIVELRARAAKGAVLSPRIYTSTPSIYSYFFSPAEAAEAVEGARAAGYDFIKIYSDGATWDSTVAAARRVKMRIAGHARMADDSMALEASVRAGYVSIEHLSGFEDYLERPFLCPDTAAWARKCAPKLRAMASAMKRAGVWNTPTLTIHHPLSSDELRYLSDEGRAAAGSARSTTNSDSAVTTGQPADRPPPVVDERTRRVVSALHEAGAGLLLGTDAMGGANGIPGFRAHDELEALVAAGLRPYDALATGTRNVAEFFGTLDSTGTVAAGKRSDLLLLRGNPLDDIRQTREIAGVMVGGRWLDRAELDARLAALAGSLETLDPGTMEHYGKLVACATRENVPLSRVVRDEGACR